MGAWMLAVNQREKPDPPGVPKTTGPILFPSQIHPQSLSQRLQNIRFITHSSRDVLPRFRGEIYYTGRLFKMKENLLAEASLLTEKQQKYRSISHEDPAKPEEKGVHEGRH